PTRVYARPLRLAPGVALDAQTLKTELDAAAYREDGAGRRPGTYARQGARWTIASRGFDDVDGRVPARRVEVVLSGGRVARPRRAPHLYSRSQFRLGTAELPLPGDVPVCQPT
ncbi:UNVERIFIED_CONTAM: hypothetical protein IGO34_25955, partial [Salmonella enterica subsp. enterica serovar Weltevreden]